MLRNHFGVRLLANVRKCALDPAPGGAVFTAFVDPTSSSPQKRRMSQILPKLPIPALDQTLEKYLRSVRPLIDDEDYEHTKELVNVFARKGGHGEKLQNQLIKRSVREDNWLEEWWLKVGYLDSRMPLPIYSNPGIIFYKDLISGNTLHEQLKLAARAVSGVMEFKAKLDFKRLPVEKGSGGRDMDMSQYGKLLNSCRVPGSRRDKIVNYNYDDPRPKHICVAHNNHFFYFDVIGGDGKLLNRQQIYDQLSLIVERSSYPWQSPLGAMTSENRSVWGQLYEKMLKNKENRKLFDILNKSIFLLCLDQRTSGARDPGAPDDAVQNLSRWAGQMLHGGGSSFNSGNRWFDKTMQLIIAKDGAFGLNYEHTPAEGLPIMRLMDYVTRYCEHPKESRLPSSSIKPPEKMKFDLPGVESEKMIHKAKQHLDISIRELDLEVIKFRNYGKKFIKDHQLSPDSLFQMALQVTYYRMHGEPAPTYESASTRIFSKGRTDTIRSCSIESVNLCKAMVDEEVSEEAKLKLFLEAINGHRNAVLEAIEGKAFDRHLLGLKMQALENGENIPDLFMDISYHLSSHFKLSTSQVPSQSDTVMCYGPLVPDGYGVCYNMHDDFFNVAISSYFTSPQTSSPVFGEHLLQTFADFKVLLDRRSDSVASALVN